MKYNAKEEQQLLTDILSLADDPEEFVRFVYPWGQKNTPLENAKGPRGWQAEVLQEVKHHIRHNRGLLVLEEEPEVLRLARCSGRGIGKSGAMSMVDHWFMSTVLGGTSITTANTEKQLTSRTWPEHSKWLTMAINGHWFDYTATSIKPAPWFADLVKTDLQIDTKYYYSQLQTWSEESPDAFAGAHNQYGLLVKFDEASGIPKPIWTVTEGFFTEFNPFMLWIVFSNGRRNTGEFYECFHRNRDFWSHKNIDGRTVEGTNRKTYQQIIDKYGADSDEARIEVYGLFPETGDRQFISSSKIRAAMERELEHDDGAALMMGVDVARFGRDESVIRFRQGRNARDVPGPFKFKKVDNMFLANKVAELIDKYKPDGVCIDGGAGAGVIDRLKERRYQIHEIMFGASAEDSEWRNVRTEIWARMRDWMDGGCLPNDADLEAELAAPEYHFVGRDGDKKALTPKEQMEFSPDDGDALALTFAVRVARRDSGSARRRRVSIAQGVGYDIFD